jgi:hypothetical protein
MKSFLKIPVLLMMGSLAACGDADTPIEDKSAATVKPLVEQKASPHTVQGMKNTMDDARGVEDMLQEHADEQRRQIDGIR